jgi:AraC-like DNA-binding protein
VVSGTFEYRSESSRGLMTPGSILLGNAGRSFECAHEHAAGDRCLSFGYAPEYFESFSTRPFRQLRIPPLRAFASLIAEARAPRPHWEELSVRLAACAAAIDGNPRERREAHPAAVRKVTGIVRAIEREPAARLPVAALARAAGLSPYHFLRTFECVTGVTPHQYLLRTRLLEAARRLANEGSKVIEIALDCGFGDLSNFNRAFRSEFGMSPRAYRASR